MMTRLNALVLFDIDGTLILSGRAGLRGMNLSFKRLYGYEGALDEVPIAGRTDRAIVIDALSRIGQPADDRQIARVRDAYLEDLGHEIGRPSSDPSCVLPGVLALLDRLALAPGVAVGLLTGNFRSGAAIKLGHFGLWDRFAFGAFGDAHVDRRALVPIAVDLAREAGHAVPAPNRVIIIGDTPLDIDCAKAHGARAVAVATGSYDRDSLVRAGADLTVDTLNEIADAERLWQ